MEEEIKEIFHPTTSSKGLSFTVTVPQCSISTAKHFKSSILPKQPLEPLGRASLLHSVIHERGQTPATHHCLSRRLSGASHVSEPRLCSYTHMTFPA